MSFLEVSIHKTGSIHVDSDICFLEIEFNLTMSFLEGKTPLGKTELYWMYKI